MGKKIEDAILSRAESLDKKLAKLAEMLHKERQYSARRLSQLRGTTPNYAHIGLPGCSDMASIAASVDRAASALEALIFQVCDDQNLT